MPQPFTPSSSPKPKAVRPRVVKVGEPWPPDYVGVVRWRIDQLNAIKADATGKLALGMKSFYAYDDKAPRAENIQRCIDFIVAWVDTYDPRNAADPRLPSRLPFILFERQSELVTFILSCVFEQTNALVDKSRDMGATWLLAAVSVWVWLYMPGSSIGWGSRKQELVDQLGVVDSIFEKMRQLINGLPRFMLPKGFSAKKHATFMKIQNPENGNVISGECGDDIGRGGRKFFYVADESAHFEHPEQIENALSENTNCRIDISSPKGIGTVFDRKREAGKEWRGPDSVLMRDRTNVFVLDWSQHPAKTKEWYETKQAKAKSEGLIRGFRQEVDHDPAAAVSGIVIAPEWVIAAIDAHRVLGIEDVGGWMGALDIADSVDGEGDLNAQGWRKGRILRMAEDFAEEDTGETTQRVLTEALKRRPCHIQYDAAGGWGTNVKAEQNRLRREKRADGQPKLPKDVIFVAWNGGAKVLYPDKHLIPGDTESPINKDYFGNFKAQAWWNTARCFEHTWRAVEAVRHAKTNFRWDPNLIISIDSTIPRLPQLKRELSQPVWKKDSHLRLIVDKKPDGAKSPNLADMLNMICNPAPAGVLIPQQTLEAGRIRAAARARAQQGMMA